MNIFADLTVGSIFFASFLFGFSVLTGLTPGSTKNARRYLFLSGFLLVVPFLSAALVGLTLILQGVDFNTLDQERRAIFQAILLWVLSLGLMFFIQGSVGLLASLATEKERVVEKKEGPAGKPRVDTS